MARIRCLVQCVEISSSLARLISSSHSHNKRTPSLPLCDSSCTMSSHQVYLVVTASVPRRYSKCTSSLQQMYPVVIGSLPHLPGDPAPELQHAHVRERHRAAAPAHSDHVHGGRAAGVSPARRGDGGHDLRHPRLGHNGRSEKEESSQAAHARVHTEAEHARTHSHTELTHSFAKTRPYTRTHTHAHTRTPTHPYTQTDTHTRRVIPIVLFFFFRYNSGGRRRQTTVRENPNPCTKSLQEVGLVRQQL